MGGGLLQSTSYFLDAKKVWTVDKDRLMMRKPSFSLLTPPLAQHCAIPQKVCPAGHCASSVTESGTHRLTIGTSAFPKSGGAVNLVLVNAMWGKQSVLHNTGEIVVLLNKVKVKGTSTEQIFLCDTVPTVAPQSAGWKQKSRTHPTPPHPTSPSVFRAIV